MHSLKKENFNLKLRIYFLEEKNPSIPEGAEAIYKQNIDLKVSDIQQRMKVTYFWLILLGSKRGVI